MNEVLDLDVLRPTAKHIQLGGEKIDVSFIPCGITFEVDKIIRGMQKFDQKKLEEGGDETRKAFDMTLDLCVLFCSVDHPEMDRKWFERNTSPAQVQAMAEAIRDSLLASYGTIEAHSKN
jgi:hypothetical protein